MKINPVHDASCHCGSVKFKLILPNGLDDLRRCDCSMCRRRGAIVASVPLDGIKFIEGEHILTLYQFNTFTAKHYFCSKCGIYTHHQRRSNPSQYGFNVACLEGINPFELGEITTYDGVRAVPQNLDRSLRSYFRLKFHATFSCTSTLPYF